MLKIQAASCLAFILFLAVAAHAATKPDQDNTAAISTSKPGAPPPLMNGPPPGWHKDKNPPPLMDGPPHGWHKDKNPPPTPKAPSAPTADSTPAKNQ